MALSWRRHDRSKGLYSESTYTHLFQLLSENEPQQWWPAVSCRQIHPEKMQDGLSTQHATSTPLVWDSHLGCIFSSGYGCSLQHSLDFDHQFDSLALLQKIFSSLEIQPQIENCRLVEARQFLSIVESLETFENKTFWTCYFLLVFLKIQYSNFYNGLRKIKFAKHLFYIKELEK